MIKEYFYYQLKHNTTLNIELTKINNDLPALLIKDTGILIISDCSDNIKTNANHLFVIHEQPEAPVNDATNYYLSDNTIEEYKNCYKYFCNEYNMPFKTSDVNLKELTEYYSLNLNSNTKDNLTAIVNWLEQSELVDLEQHQPNLYQWLLNNKSVLPINYKINNKYCIYILPDKWGKQFNAYVKFTALYPDKLTSKDCIYDGTNITYWVTEQRTAYKQGYINKEREHLLNSIHFVWNIYDKEWYDGYAFLCNYLEETGTTLIPKRDTYKGYNLGSWCETCRKQYKANKLSQEKIDLLNQIGFVWDVLEYEWQANLQLYKEYIEEFKTTSITKRTIYKNKKLGIWIQIQRKTYKENKISESRIKQLLEINSNIFD